jgi:hypothetical protein
VNKNTKKLIDKKDVVPSFLSWYTSKNAASVLEMTSNAKKMSGEEMAPCNPAKSRKVGIFIANAGGAASRRRSSSINFKNIGRLKTEKRIPTKAAFFRQETLS